MRKLTHIALVWVALASTFVAGLLITPDNTRALSLSTPVRISDNGGGSVHTFRYFYDAIRASGVPVEVTGICVSACTLVFELPRSQVCVYEGASFGFHLASVDGKGDPEITKVIQRRYYPPSLVRWLEDHEREYGPLTLEHVVYMSAKEVVALGIFPYCK